MKRVLSRHPPAPPEAARNPLAGADGRAARCTAAQPGPSGSLAAGGLPLAAPIVPTPADYFFFMAGVPVVPWIEPRPLAETWQVWLAQLRAVIERQLIAESAEGTEAAGAWERWSARHVYATRFRRVTNGLAWLLTRLAACGEDERAGAHLVGHSAGGAAALALLAGMRAHIFPAPRVALRSVVTLDAAVTGLAGRWTNLRAFLRQAARTDLDHLGDWARARGITLLTIANIHDRWSHAPLGDIPYLGLPVGLPARLRAHLDGSTHAELRDSPAIIEALWPVAVALGGAAGGDNQKSSLLRFR